MLAFLGEITLSMGRLLTGRAQFRQSDFWLEVEEVGPQLLQQRADLVVLNEALGSLKKAANQVTMLTDPQSPLFRNLNRASEELAGAAQAVERLSREGSPTVVSLYEMLQEVSRAAHATRMLVETLEQQPQSIFWGKPDPDGNR